MPAPTSVQPRLPHAAEGRLLTSIRSGIAPPHNADGPRRSRRRPATGRAREISGPEPAADDADAPSARYRADRRSRSPPTGRGHARPDAGSGRRAEGRRPAPSRMAIPPAGNRPPPPCWRTLRAGEPADRVRPPRARQAEEEAGRKSPRPKRAARTLQRRHQGRPAATTDGSTDTADIRGFDGRRRRLSHEFRGRRGQGRRCRPCSATCSGSPTRSRRTSSGRITIASSAPQNANGELLGTLETALVHAGPVAHPHRQHPTAIAPLDARRRHARRQDGTIATGFGISVDPAALHLGRLDEQAARLASSSRPTASRSIPRATPSSSAARARAASEIVRAIRAFDGDWMHKQSVSMFELKRAHPEEVIDELTRVFDNDKDGDLAGVVQFKAVKRLRSIMVISKNDTLIHRAGAWIRRLDHEDNSATQLDLRLPPALPRRTRDGEARQRACSATAASGGSIRTVPLAAASSSTRAAAAAARAAAAVSSGSSGGLGSSGGILSSSNGLTSASFGSGGWRRWSRQQLGRRLARRRRQQQLERLRLGLSVASAAPAAAGLKGELADPVEAGDRPGQRQRPQAEAHRRHRQQHDRRLHRRRDLQPRSRDRAAPARHPAAAGRRQRHHRRGAAQRRVEVRRAVLPQPKRRRASAPSASPRPRRCRRPAVVSTSAAIGRRHRRLATGLTALDRQRDLARQRLGPELHLRRPVQPEHHPLGARLDLEGAHPLDALDRRDGEQAGDARSRQPGAGDDAVRAVEPDAPDAPTVNSVTYLDTGIILKIIPRVGQNGNVDMQIDQEISSVVPDASGSTTGSLTPTISKRRIASDISVQAAARTCCSPGW